MNLNIRKSQTCDIDFLEKLEINSFSPIQQNSKINIRRSLKSNFQEVLIVDSDGVSSTSLGALVLFKYKSALRIYSIAILPEYQNIGIGSYLVDYVKNMANENEYKNILIEVDAKNNKLINWYKTNGFKQLSVLKDYYGIGEDALKMEYKCKAIDARKKTNNLIVINQPNKWLFPDVNAKVISVKEYISNPIYHTCSDFRIFNLCSSYKYQSYGYYVSLLAAARGHRVIPSSVTIRDFKLLNVIHSAAYDIDEIINKALDKIKADRFHLNIYFGQTSVKGVSSLVNKLYQLFEAPLFEVEFIKHDKWIIKNVKILTLSKIPDDEIDYIYEFARKYFNKRRFNKTRIINYKYDIAILTDPNEPTPPSCKTGLQEFKNAANRRGLYAEFITKADFDKLNEFDALFIRETTSVNNHTYEFSRMAYAEGLVVIDDPWSILRCSNKIFQNEIFRKHKILTPETIVFTKNIFEKKSLDNMNFPLVLKQPDSAFSLGIIKVDNKEEAVVALNQLFKKSDMVVCQEFLYSEYDWRIGVLDNEPLFACKYFMSKGHWQIYNWKGEEEDNSGDSETVDISAVPEEVIKIGLKAAALIGDGLYGVDLKLVNGKVYVVEVNDNPNIDAGIEDFVLKEKLYDQIIDSIYNRIEISKNIQKINFRHK
ncbi:GNAT family N-acetyltransferase [Prolixibacteraceae bacterium Z1-6]|uniref:GNAT family N-acetyltransferase n=1 Tax=Draconibacterium aestuarii TaxID=2998507 RepID=A0A9X3FBK1_9BACT|nr:GNAT family N-acetyltransferase [Prolixibacteraceae bacterium Z1-6]